MDKIYVIILAIVLFGAGLKLLWDQYKEGGNGLSSKDAFAKIAAWNFWVELANDKFEPWMQGKVLRIHDGYACGIGILIEENLPEDFAEDFGRRNIISRLEDGRLVTRFLVDLDSYAIFSELTSTDLQSLLKPHLDNPEEVRSRVYLNSMELQIPHGNQDEAKFDRVWSS